MNPFVRFIFSILTVGIVVNIAIVFVANAQSQHRQLLQDKDDKEKLSNLLSNPDLSLRHLDVIVESQRVDYEKNPIESTLLVRQYHSTGSDQSVSTAVRRIVIPGNRLALYGTMLEFNEDFAADAPDFQILRGKKLVYFSYLCGENEKPIPNQPDERFTFMPQWETPDLTRIDIFAARPSIFEVRLWKYIWNRLPDEQHTLPWNTKWKNNINATFLDSAVIPVQLEHVYTATISGSGDNGTLFWQDDSGANQPLIHQIVAQMKFQEAAAQAGATSPAVATLPRP